MQTSGEIPRQLAVRNPDILDRTRRIPTPPDKPGHAAGNHGRHRRDVAVPQRVERIVLRTAGASVDHRHVGIAARPEITAVQAVDVRIVAGCSGDRLFDGNLCQAREMRDRVEHT